MTVSEHRATPEYEIGYGDGFAGRQMAQPGCPAYADGYRAAQTLVDALKEAGGKRSAGGYEFVFSQDT